MSSSPKAINIPWKNFFLQCILSKQTYKCSGVWISIEKKIKCKTQKCTWASLDFTTFGQVFKGSFTHLMNMWSTHSTYSSIIQGWFTPPNTSQYMPLWSQEDLWRYWDVDRQDIDFGFGRFTQGLTDRVSGLLALYLACDIDFSVWLMVFCRGRSSAVCFQAVEMLRVTVCHQSSRTCW